VLVVVLVVVERRSDDDGLKDGCPVESPEGGVEEGEGGPVVG
jgi:hypothetical protein